jgi:hypothetical protein
MRRRYVAALAALALSAGVATAAPATAGTDSGRRGCQAGFHAAVVEDNEAYNAKDAARYEAVLNPRMIFWQDGVTTYGRDAILATARQSFALPGWTWTYEIESETVYGCSSGIAVATARLVLPERDIDRRFAFTMYLVREHGRWTVAADNVHRVS